MDFDGGEDPIFDFDVAPSASLKAKRNGSTGMKFARKKRTFGKAFERQNSVSSNNSNGTSTNMGSSSDSIGSTHSASQRSSSGGLMKRKSKKSGSKDGDSSFSSSSLSRQSKTTQSNKSIRSSIRKRIRQRREEEGCDDDNGDNQDCSSVRSYASSPCNSTVSSPTGPLTIVRMSLTSTRSQQLSVRRGVAGFSAYAVQDAGTYQMLHDECSYLCSTILSRRILPSKAIGAAIELATLLSSRKTRSILWQGGSTDEHDGNWDECANKNCGANESTSGIKSYYDSR